MDLTCGHCGNALAGDDVFCGNCGVRAGAVSSLAAPGRPGAPSWAPPAPPAWPPAPPADPVSPAGGHPQVLPASTDAALGQAAPNETYLGARLLYEQTPEGSFDPLANNRWLFYMVRQAIFLWVIYWVLAAVSGIFFTIIGISQISSEVSEVQYGQGVSLPGAFQVYLILAALFAVVFLVAFLVSPIPAILSEWKFLVDDKGAARPIVFDHVIYAFRRRNTPVDHIGIRRLTSIQDAGIRDYLEVRRGVFTGFISCFEEGNDLYVGWTFWLRMAPYRWLLLRLELIWRELTFQANELYVTLRYESAKAMREAIHSAAREGIDVATDRIEAVGQGMAANLPVSSGTRTAR